MTVEKQSEDMKDENKANIPFNSKRRRGDIRCVSHIYNSHDACMIVH